MCLCFRDVFRILNTRLPYKPGLLFLFMVLLCYSGVRAEEPLAVGGRKQLFIDRHFMAQSDGLELRMNPPQKLGLLLDMEGKPLENGDYLSHVIDDGSKIRLYMGASSLSVLESDDGLHFRRTGATIPGGILTTIFLDRHDPDPARRYKIFYVKTDESKPFDYNSDGVYGACSADGLTFTSATRVLANYIDNPCNVDFDERIGKYVIYTRAFDYTSENQRQIGRIETDDPLKPWPVGPVDKPEHTRLSITQVPVVLAADASDNPHSDIYYNSATLYPWAQDAYFMFTAQFRHFSPDRNPYIRPPKGQWEDFGLLEVQLAASRDGIHWTRPSREPYFPTGLADEWDRWYAVMAPGMVKRGNYIYQYYVSSGHTHDSAIVRPEYDNSAPRVGGLGVTRQRLDGFVSADADERGGWLTTPPMTMLGNRLRLNIDTGAMGTAWVELRDANNLPIPGFTLADCEEICGNFIDQAVYWKGKNNVTDLQGKPIRLHIKLNRAKLFAFQFLAE